MNKKSNKLPTFPDSFKRHWDVIKNHIDVKSTLNAAKAVASYELGTDKSYGYPLFIKFEPSIACQLSCDSCRGNFTREKIKGGNEKPFMDIGLYREIIEDCGSTLLEASLYDEGEPLLSPYIVEMVNIAAGANVGTVISTNGSFDPASEKTQKKLFGLADAGLDKLIVAIDGIRPCTHEAYRKGGKLHYTLENLKQIAKYVKDNNIDMKIEWQMINFDTTSDGRWADNTKEQDECREKASTMGIDFKLMPNSLTKNQDMKYKRKKRCIMPYIGLSVDYKGNVGACSIYDSPGMDMGKIDDKNSIKDIWNNEGF